jgi:DNA modification methylase
LILVGDCRAVLSTLEPESVHCVVTSPPYWGLRSYGTEGQIWGGDPTCEHTWGEDLPGDSKGSSGTPTDKNNRGEGYARGAARGNQCACGAWKGELGLEPTPDLYVQHMVEVFRAVHRVLRTDGTVWLNLGDSYVGGGNNRGNTQSLSAKQASNRGATGQCAEHAKNIRDVPGLKRKDMVGIPWRVAFALQENGWYLRSDIVWSKPNAMPEPVTDRPTKAHEFVFLLSKSTDYFYDYRAIQEPAIVQKRWPGIGPQHAAERDREEKYEPMMVHAMRNKRTVWSIPTSSFPGAHFATMPPALAEICIRAGTSDKVCGKCFTQWVRVVIQHKATVERYHLQAADAGAVPPHRGTTERPGGYVGAGSETVGWQPDCSCNAESKSPVVLDPFGGAGTTALVSSRLGRRSISIEINPAYAHLAETRLMEESPLFSAE